MERRLKRNVESHRDDLSGNGMDGHPHLNIRIDQKDCSVPAGISVAAALIANGKKVFRQTDEGEARGLFCGMGVCYDCLVTIDGIPDQRACMTLVREGMHVRTAVKRR
jgi:predicted molibdopterin-dependent oxidoreductase YjgC